jgi:diguanylate cyclase (GGDEF)-like protein
MSFRTKLNALTRGGSNALHWVRLRLRPSNRHLAIILLFRIGAQLRRRLTSMSVLSVRLLGVGFTVLILIALHFLPSQTMLLHYNPNNHYSLITSHLRDDTTSATWLDDYSFSRFKCDISDDANAACGYVIEWPNQPLGLIDFASFHSLRIRLKYVGPSHRIRIYLRNFHQAYSDLSRLDTLKFESATINVSEFDRDVIIPMKEFIVSDGWIQRYDIPRQYVQPDFSAVRSLVVDFPHPGATGEHVMEVQRIELVGDYIAKETAYLTLLIIWMLVFLGEGAYRYYRMNRRFVRAQARAQNLANYARELKTETSLYKKLSGVDPLTGIYNRSGLKPLLGNVFRRLAQSDSRTEPMGVLMVIDIDHFKLINDRFGHGTGDQVIRSVAHTLANIVRSEDLFARWGGEEFLLVCPGIDCATALIISEKLRIAVQNLQIKNNADISVSISIGLTQLMPNESFTEVFERADQALYDAKRNGRNRIILAEDSVDFEIT